MKFASLLEMTKGRWREFCREPSALFFVIAMPLVWMLILGYAFTSSTEDSYRIGFLKHGQDPMEAEISRFLTEKPNISVERGEDKAKFDLSLSRGEIPLFLEMQGGQLLYHLSARHADAVKAKRYLNDWIQTCMGRQDILITKAVESDAKPTRYVDFLIPGLLALSFFTTSLFGTGMTIVANRRENLLKRYAATPMSTLAYILSHVFGRYMIFAVEFMVVMLGGLLFFNFHIAGSFWHFLLVSLLGVSTFTAIASLCSSRTKNTAFYNGLVNLLTLTMMFPSGIWFSRQGFPLWLQKVSDFLPLTALVDALRAVALDGQSLWSVSSPLMILISYAVACTIAARYTFRWY